MTQHMLFRGESRLSLGGANDFIATFDSVEEAQASDADPKEWLVPRTLEEHYEQTWAHVAVLEANGDLQIVASRAPGRPWRAGS